MQPTGGGPILLTYWRDYAAARRGLLCQRLRVAYCAPLAVAYCCALCEPHRAPLGEPYRSVLGEPYRALLAVAYCCSLSAGISIRNAAGGFVASCDKGRSTDKPGFSFRCRSGTDKRSRL